MQFLWQQGLHNCMELVSLITEEWNVRNSWIYFELRNTTAYFCVVSDLMALKYSPYVIKYGEKEDLLSCDHTNCLHWVYGCVAFFQDGTLGAMWGSQRLFGGWLPSIQTEYFCLTRASCCFFSQLPWRLYESLIANWSSSMLAWVVDWMVSILIGDRHIILILFFFSWSHNTLG